ESSGVPIGGSFRATHVSFLDKLGTAVRADPAGPRQPVDEGFGQQDLAVGSIQYVEEPIAIGHHQELSVLPAIARVNQDRRLGRVPNVNIMRGELIVPFQLSSI